MGVVYLLRMMKLACFELQSHWFIGITEGYALQHQFVNSLNCKDWLVARVVENMCIYRLTTDDVGSHLQAVFQLLESREEYFLQYLIVAEIATWQIIADKHNLLW